MRRGKDRDCSTIIKTKKSPELKNEGTVSSYEDALLWSSGYFNFKSRFIAFELWNFVPRSNALSNSDLLRPQLCVNNWRERKIKIVPSLLQAHVPWQTPSPSFEHIGAYFISWTKSLGDATYCQQNVCEARKQSGACLSRTSFRGLQSPVPLKLLPIITCAFSAKNAESFRRWNQNSSKPPRKSLLVSLTITQF